MWADGVGLDGSDLVVGWWVDRSLRTAALEGLLWSLRPAGEEHKAPTSGIDRSIRDRSGAIQPNHRGSGRRTRHTSPRECRRHKHGEQQPGPCPPRWWWPTRNGRGVETGGDASIDPEFIPTKSIRSIDRSNQQLDPCPSLCTPKQVSSPRRPPSIVGVPVGGRLRTTSPHR